jgi:hypothetical protein
MFTAFSLTGLVWLLTALVVIAAVAVLAARNARPTSSIAKVLYDAEHPERAK